MFEAKVCPGCGNAVRDEAIFCLDCGQRIDASNGAADVKRKDSSVDEGKLKNQSIIEDIISDDLLSEDSPGEAPFLSVIEGTDKGMEIPLQKKLYIGRTKKANGLKLNDPYMSREHVLIEEENEDYILKNLSTTNGTKVNGEKIEEHKLAPGDIVEIGFTVMSFQKER